jgi:hypothetical protein
LRRETWKRVWRRPGRPRSSTPFSPVLALNLAAVFAFLGDETGAQRQIERLKALDSTGQFIDSTMAWVAERRGDLKGRLRTWVKR